MIQHRITILDSQRKQLESWLTSHPEGHEKGAFVLFKRLARPVNELEQSDRYIVVKIVELTDDFVIDSSISHLHFNMKLLPQLYFECEKESLELGFVHSHPNGYQDFSPMDDKNESTILQGLTGCNGLDSRLVNLIFVDGKWIGRIRTINTIYPIRHINILGEFIELHGVDLDGISIELQKRQEAAFGKSFNKHLQTLRVGIIGLGGTGSPTAVLLARMGVKELVIVDEDKIDGSNLNRVTGFSTRDIGQQKAETLRNYILDLELDTKILAISENINNSPTAVDAISSCDIVFGCTDDNRGRELLNEALYYYALVYIDVGLTGYVDNTDPNKPFLRDHQGRVSCILPEQGACLFCQRVIKSEWIRYEEELNARPELKDIDAKPLKEEYYLVGGGEQAPGVGSFTGITAYNGVATLMDLLTGFRNLPDDIRRDNIWTDFINMNIYSNYPIDNTECPNCRQRKLLLKNENGYRLERPQLGTY